MSDPASPLRLTLFERIATLGALILSVAPGILLAALMPSPHAAIAFGVLWGTSLGALITGLVALRLHDRLLVAIHALNKKIAETPKLPIIPSYPVAPPIVAPHVPARHVTPAPISRHSFHSLDDLSGETLPESIPAITIHPLETRAVSQDQEATLEERHFPTEKLDMSVLPALATPAPDEECTLSEAARTTSNIDIPGAMLMSMAEIDAEMTPVHTLSPERVMQAATRPFSTPAPLILESNDPHDETTRPVAQSEAHFANRATIPLDAHVVQSFLSDQRSTQKIDNIPEFMSQPLKRKPEAVETRELFAQEFDST